MDNIRIDKSPIVFKPQNTNIKDLIFTVRGLQVLLDSDVAILYGYETKAINQAANRNKKRFPPEFRFQLTLDELEELSRFQIETMNIVEQQNSSKSQFVTLNTGRGSNVK